MEPAHDDARPEDTGHDHTGHDHTGHDHTGADGHEPDIQLSFANERTFLAWERTALGLITAGLAITQLLPSFDFPGGRRLIGLPLIGLGIVIALVAYWEWHANQEAMRHDRPIPRTHLPLVVAIVVAVVASIGFVLVIAEGAGS